MSDPDFDGKAAGKVLMVGASLEAELSKLLHANRAPQGVELIGEIPVVVNPYLERGVYLMAEPIRIRPPVLLPDPLPVDDFSIAFRYSMEWAMPNPRKFIGIDWGFDDRTCRQIWRDLMAMSKRWKLRRQRRLDYRSNVRRRKRWEELAARRKRS